MFQFQRNLNRNITIFVEENTFEIVICQKGGNFLQGQMG